MTPSESWRSQGSPETLKRRTVSAAKWRFALSMVQAVLQFGVGVVLARLLPPRDFGLLGLAMIVIGLGRFASNLGLAPAVIQRKELSDRHVRVAFTLSVVSGAVVTAVVMLFAPLSADIFREDRLPPVLAAISLMFVIAGAGNCAGALLRRSLDFQTIFRVSVSSYVFGYALVSVAMAVAGFGVWSLVMGALSQRLLETVIMLAIVRHPKAPLVSLKEVKHLTSFGLGFTLGGLADYAARTGDNFVVGRWLGSSALGLYTRAYGLMSLPQDHMTRVIHNVLFPAFSEAQDAPERLGRALLQAVALTSLVAAPLMVGMVVAAPHMIIGVFGENWAGSIEPLQVLCAAGLFRAVYPLSEAIARSTGRVFAASARTLVFGALVVGGGILSASWGLSAVAGAVGIASLFIYFAMAQLALQIVPVGWGEFFRSQQPGFVLAVVVGAAGGLVRLTMESLVSGHLTIFLLIFVTCAVSFGAGIYLLPERLRPAALFGDLQEIVENAPIPAAFRGGLLKLLWV